ncbi:MAG: alpha/beta hydrolase [Propionibacteriaceae bacterium]|jgi:hypothetical protein|nr:alpha/beta hydrolase [Propionibacteriaceae bacterium]
MATNPKTKTSTSTSSKTKAAAASPTSPDQPTGWAGLKHDKAALACLLSFILMFAGCWLGYGAERDFGGIRVEHTEFMSEGGAMLNGVLYIPEGVTEHNPAPGVVLAAGYSASYDGVEGHAIELARRGIVCLSIDTYGHGESENADIVPSAMQQSDWPEYNDVGMYSALQYLGHMPYVDSTRVGITGHSLGGLGSRNAAIKAYTNHQTDPSVVVPWSIFVMSNAWGNVKDAQGNAYDPVNQLGVNYGDDTGQFDEFAPLLWGVDGHDLETAPAFANGMGFEGGQVDTFYAYQDPTPLTDKAAEVAAAAKGQLRVVFNLPIAHSQMTFNNDSVARALEWFDLTLMDGEMTIAYDSQIWRWKNVGTGIALVAFLVFVATLGLVLLRRVRFFQAVKTKEPDSLSTFDTTKNKVIYIVVYLIAMIAPATIYTWTSGFRLHSPYVSSVMNVMLPVSDYFNLPTANGLVILNGILLAFYLLMFAAIWFFVAKPAGASLKATGLVTTKEVAGKGILLGLTVFLGAVLALSFMTYFFHVDLGFWKFVFREMPAEKWLEFLKYLPFFFLYFFFNAVILNSLTRLNKVKEWVNVVLMILANTLGLAALQAYDYIPYYLGHGRGIPNAVGSWSPVMNMAYPNPLSGIMLWGLLFILPVCAIIARVYYKKTGNAWTAGVVNGLLVTFFVVCTACVQLPWQVTM